MILVDTSIVINVSAIDSTWADWSQQQLDLAARRERLVINDIVNAELSVGHRRFQDVDALMARMGITISAIPRRRLFLAGKAFQRCRRLGGTRTEVLAAYFPGIELITRSLD